jgi:hypothetical protein
MSIKQLDYNPISLTWLASSNFFVVTGTNNQAQLLSRQGISLKNRQFHLHDRYLFELDLESGHQGRRSLRLCDRRR